MKKLYFLDEEERQRILNIHESATKRQYLSEQATPPIIVTDYDKAYEYKFENGEYTFRGKPGTTYGNKYSDWQPSKTDEGKLAIKKVIDTKGKTTQTQVKPVENPTSVVDPSKAAQDTSVVNKTAVEKPISNTTEIPSKIAQPSGNVTKEPTVDITNTSSGNNFSETDLNTIIA